MQQFLTTLLILTTFTSFSQSFEGRLTYVTDMEVAENLQKMGMTKEFILKKMTSEGSWSDTIWTSYKQGNYYSLNNSTPKTQTIYRADDNHLYSMEKGDSTDICVVIEASIDLEYTMSNKMPTVTKLDTLVDVNGTPCSIVSIEWGSGTYDYYYNSNKLAVDPTLFSKHIYDGWSAFLAISNALPLRISKKVNGLMTITMTLVEEKPSTIDDSLFSIPKLVPDPTLSVITIANRQIMRIEK